ncbi:MAG TPA: cytochrome C oxidase subunit IV family protein [Fimbriimonadaceae bacterium]|nr:cytochrome C oxidase subunit IV family protein [Fimbriimonadaceae bacterium]
MAAHTEDHGHHITPMSVYVKTLFALAFLMALTIAASYVDFGKIIGNSALGSVINNVIAMTIACLKAVLVIQFFMGVKYSSKLTKMWAWAGFVWFLLMGMTFGDYFTRHWEPAPGWYAEDTELPPRESEIRLRPTPKVHSEEGGH